MIDRAAELKGELVAFARSPRFARRLDSLLVAAADSDGALDEDSAVLAFDHFALQHRLADGSTVVERFVAQRRPSLHGPEREMMLGWRDVVEGCFEVRRFDGDAVKLHNLLDDLAYHVYSNLGRKALGTLRPGMFVIGRIVPLHPATEAWLVSGNLAVFPKSTGKRMAQIALEQLVGRPELMRRNPSLLSRAWEIQAQHREEFIAQVGADLVILPPREAEKVLWKHYDRLRGKGTKKAPPLAELGELPEKLLAADTVALIYDDVEGLSFFHDFGCLDDLFADPALARDRTYLQLLRGYLRDESVSPLAIRRLVSRHPNGADRVFRALLRRPSFSWTQDGEKLLERHKKSFLNHEPMPAVSVVGGRLAELLGTSR